MVCYANKAKVIVDELLKRFKWVKAQRVPVEGVMQEVCELVLPSRSDFTTEIKDFSKVGRKIFDGTPQSALMIWVDGIQGYVVSSALRWFALSLVDKEMLEDDDTKRWLKQVEAAIYEKLSASNFYSVLPEYLMDASSVGTANKFIHEDLNTGRVIFNVEHPKNVWLVNNRFGEVVEVFVIREKIGLEVLF